VLLERTKLDEESDGRHQIAWCGPERRVALPEIDLGFALPHQPGLQETQRFGAGMLEGCMPQGQADKDSVPGADEEEP
jgi:hypothetical protein